MTCAECKWWQPADDDGVMGVCGNDKVDELTDVDVRHPNGLFRLLFHQDFGCIFAEGKEND